ncbi:Exopolyphosphatase [Saliniradius amylolyticus]|uniref:Exopolyphosphatase n=1 Tax=Saliniradius amylolyticus TaxID=2183582 RepID=A0A2S2E0V0_9ALTE|nr:exopolyphosphatase [Saliniradius amylolyticus]AWL11268.1 Exopolyphosphatase [Saliniradius amylolyticus]
MSELSRVFEDVESREATHVAALDIGSNSFHLVIARVIAGSVQILHRVKERVRLAEGLNADNILEPEAIERGLAALAKMADSLQGFHPDSVRIVATNTLRNATNARDFIKAARSVIPYPIEIISGMEEARLIYQGVAHTTDAKGQHLVIDIGGGSTEFIIGTGFQPQLMRSIQMGCVSFNQRYFAKGKLTEKRFNKAMTAVQQEMEFIQHKYRKLGWDRAIGTSGTIKALTSAAQSLNPDLPPDTLTLNELNQLRQQCIQAGHIDQLNLTGVGEDRKPVIAAGLCVLTGIFESLGIQSLQFSSAALREGVIYEMEEQLAHGDIRERTAESLAIRYDVDTDQARRALQTSLELFDQVKKSWQLDNEARQLLGWAALLYEVGLQINSRRVQHHSAYILNHTDLPGFNQEQQLLLATLARFHRKKVRSEDVPEFVIYSKESVHRLIALIQIATTLHIQRQDNVLPQITAKAEEQRLELTFTDNWLAASTLVQADLETTAMNLRHCGIELIVQ